MINNIKRKNIDWGVEKKIKTQNLLKIDHFGP